ncbi:MAG: septum formation initiator family protein [Candidatus Latescibacterota bacterium]|jgi:cell division protein FtsB|nr:MAG: septum formation initiator family protein [Candidatus Latescibacterota bacterium]
MKSLWGQGSRYLRVRRSVDVSPRFARAMLVAVVALVALIFIAGDVGLWRLWSAQRDMAQIKARIAELETRNALLDAEIARLQSDAFAIEKVAREKYGYLREGDRVYRIVTPEALPEKAPDRRSALDRSGRKP